MGYITSHFSIVPKSLEFFFIEKERTISVPNVSEHNESKCIIYRTIIKTK